MGGVGIVRRNISTPPTSRLGTLIVLHELVSSTDPALFVVTTADGTQRSGCVVGFVTQVSIDPERLLVGISRLNHTYRVAAAAETMVVHLLTERDRGLARRFGERTGDEVDKFDGVTVTGELDGVPVLTTHGPYVAGRIVERVPLGDHLGYLLEPRACGGAPALPLRTSTIHLEAGHPLNVAGQATTRPGPSGFDDGDG